MDVESGNLYWPNPTHGSMQWEALENDIECDVAIIGGGITGALVAWHLIEAGVDTIVLDKRRIAAGSTSASTSLLLYELDTPLSELIEMRGEAEAVLAWRMCRAAIGKIAAIEHKLGHDCGFDRRPSLYLASNDEDAQSLSKEFDTRRRFGFDLDFLSRRDIEQRCSFSRPAALWTPDGAQIDPWIFTRRLIEAAAARGLRVFEQTAVREYVPDRASVHLRTENGARVHARRVVFAMGYETEPYLPRDIVKLVSSYAFASTPLQSFDGWPESCLIWETARPYLYLRSSGDGRAIVGGADEPFSDPERRDRLIADKGQELLRSFRALFPHQDIQVECAWAGTFGETKDSLPYVGELPEYPHALFSLSYGANGVIFALLAAEMIRDAILGQANSEAHIFRFDR